MHCALPSKKLEAGNMAAEIHVPALGESVVDAVVANWLKNEGDTVVQGEVLVELETDKVNLDVAAEQNGVLQQITKRVGDVVSVGEVLGLIGENASAAEQHKAAPAPLEQPPAAPSPTPASPSQVVPTPEVARVPSGPLAAIDGHRPPSPLARRIAAEHKVDLSQV